MENVSIKELNKQYSTLGNILSKYDLTEEERLDMSCIMSLLEAFPDDDTEESITFKLVE